ncbi:alanine racemase [Candidatus Planktophila sulfonica]|uniref:Alanine racemase n=1 Tax=Candidatus Planktophila sulfonica TaxID=1884904 RepID=A0A249KI06_9ACTN|nr:alanine racemase [Candidatus Planktophila sulfonica]ASY16325.1 alanine racemase [Candidatus Planktophila sulfonica]
MRAEVIVDLSAIKHNVELLKKTAGTKLLAVVKADAYGHGLVPVAKAAISAGADYLGVALLEEAIALREAGIEAPILAWLVQPGSDFKKAIELDIDVAAASLKALQEISDASESKKARVHLEVDTGMTRGGFLSEWDQLTAEHLKNVEVVGIFSHFARADEPGEAQNDEQLARFNDMVERVRSFGFTNVIRHLSNSAATIKNHAAAFDMVRTGIAMYGLSPDVKTLGNSQSLALRPAMQLRAAMYLVKDVPADTPVGYGASESTTADTKLGVIAMGYADGIPRIAHGAGVWSAGKKAFSIGRVSMDQFVVDLGAQSKAQSGDWVVIFGNGSHGEFTADDWGAASQTINYEIVTRIGPRVPRIYAAHVY